MEIFRQLDALPDQLRGGALTIGNFDGVHLGHAAIVDVLKSQARRGGGPAIVFTFDPHPVRLLRPEQTPPPLTWTKRKAELLAEIGVDAVIAYPTDLPLLQLTAKDFFEQIVCKAVAAQAVVEGENFYFGRDRQGDIPTLRALCRSHDMELMVVPPVSVDRQPVSSSHIRNLLAAGDVATAARMLTRPYRLRGMVTHGAGRGGKLGFPTANLEAIDTLIPADGVYAGIAWANDRQRAAAIHIGANPTFGEMHKKVEIHLVDCSETLYGMPLEVDFVMRLRDTGKFESADSLKDQLAQDVDKVRVWWAANKP